ncbi:MAG: SIMPL domain-containing protein [Candidatus Baltobacteraceae bacterium]
MNVFLCAAVLLAQIVPAMGLPRMAAVPATPFANDGISVSGAASVAAPAASAQVILRIYAAQNTALTSASLRPIIDALTSAGVRRSDILTPAYVNTSARVNQATLAFTVNDPTLAQFERGLAAVGSAVAASNVNLTDAQVTLRAANCAQLLEQAQNAAVAQARVQAESIARHIGAKLGRVLAIDARMLYGNADNACTTQYSIGQGSMQQPMPIGDYLRVKVNAAVSVRYAIAH